MLNFEKKDDRSGNIIALYNYLKNNRIEKAMTYCPRACRTTKNNHLKLQILAES